MASSIKALKIVCLHYDDSEKKGLKRKLNDQTNAAKQLVACSAHLNREHKRIRSAVFDNAIHLLAEAMTVLRSGKETGLDIAEVRLVYNKLRVVVDELAPLIPDE